jgi:hypothetical protein
LLEKGAWVVYVKNAMGNWVDFFLLKKYLKLIEELNVERRLRLRPPYFAGKETSN